MSAVKLRTEIKKAVERLERDQLELLAEYLSFLTRPSLGQRLAHAGKAVASRKWTHWRKVRSDV
jgi:hypothetical protein